MNFPALPEISPAELHCRLQGDAPPVVLDCREPREWQLVRLEEALLAPLSELAQQGIAALPPEVTPEQEVVVYCHHGIRSAQVTLWLLQQGYHRVYNLEGGIDAWAMQVDPSLLRY